MWKTLIPSNIKLKSIQCIWIQFLKINLIQFNNWIKIQLNCIQIQSKTIGMQIGGKCIQYLLMNMLLEKSLIHKFEKTPFHASSLGNELTNSNLELSNV